MRKETRRFGCDLEGIQPESERSLERIVVDEVGSVDMEAMPWQVPGT